ncbi:hypothetical protein PSTT_01860 [Puccinia striiformis]|uniref:Uncharacterized protein n=1 Tax=Puccinia striiformis TaxID=27350 RepID=A0A2S4W259_9BASI|nr:hypothetical protein PSTT_01860 [Puccinia striiformis]
MTKIPAMRPDPPCNSRLGWPIDGKASATAKGRLSVRCVAMMAEIWFARLTDHLVGSPAKRPPFYTQGRGEVPDPSESIVLEARSAGRKGSFL